MYLNSLNKPKESCDFWRMEGKLIKQGMGLKHLYCSFCSNDMLLI